MVGWNSRMDGFQGAVLGVKLKYLEDWTESRRRNAALYGELLRDVHGIVVPYEAEYARHVYHVYAIRTPERSKLMEALGGAGIAAGIHYPVPVHLQDAYAFLGLKEGSYPVAERCAAEELSLPMFAELTAEQIETVAEGVKRYAGNNQDYAVPAERRS
jgi:dTDP-4-amino-4,6-dideoxygalactose transaminase